MKAKPVFGYAPVDAEQIWEGWIFASKDILIKELETSYGLKDWRKMAVIRKVKITLVPTKRKKKCLR